MYSYWREKICYSTQSFFSNKKTFIQGQLYISYYRQSFTEFRMLRTRLVRSSTVNIKYHIHQAVKITFLSLSRNNFYIQKYYFPFVFWRTLTSHFRLILNQILYNVSKGVVYLNIYQIHKIQLLKMDQFILILLYIIHKYKCIYELQPKDPLFNIFELSLVHQCIMQNTFFDVRNNHFCTHTILTTQKLHQSFSMIMV